MLVVLMSLPPLTRRGANGIDASRADVLGQDARADVCVHSLCFES
jgi:hypothetical protein